MQGKKVNDKMTTVSIVTVKIEVKKDLEKF